jgi:hypothetical protein
MTNEQIESFWASIDEYGLVTKKVKRNGGD